MKTSMALSFLDLRRYRWLPYLLIAMTLFAVLAGIGPDSVRRISLRGGDGRRTHAGRGGSCRETRPDIVRTPGDALMMARAFSLRASDPRYLSEYLNWLKTEYSPVYLSFAVTDVQGTVVAATEPSLVGRDYSRAASFIAARATRRLDIADIAVQEAARVASTRLRLRPRFSTRKARSWAP